MLLSDRRHQELGQFRADDGRKEREEAGRQQRVAVESRNKREHCNNDRVLVIRNLPSNTKVRPFPLPTSAPALTGFLFAGGRSQGALSQAGPPGPEAHQLVPETAQRWSHVFS